MTLNELKHMAEAARGSGEHDWFVAEGLADLLRLKDFSNWPEEDAVFIAAASPATVLKLLEMIAVLRGGIQKMQDYRYWDHHMRISVNVLSDVLQRADEIERSLGEST